jgi:alginate O-acetyltransferase complex protein AlgI
MFGLTIPQNFNSPYKALDVADFWRRWHISLSTCLRDYLYIPLGGSRGSDGATYRNLLLTMVLGGLWHGANWTFVLWGLYHGLLLAAYRAVAPWWDRRPLPVRRTATFLLVVIGWVLFRSTNLAMAGHILAVMFSWRPGTDLPGLWPLMVAIAGLSLLCWFAPNTNELRHQWTTPVRLAMAGLYALCLLSICSGSTSPFLYFQF